MVDGQILKEDCSVTFDLLNDPIIIDPNNTLLE